MEVDLNFQYDITCAAEGACRVINVSTEGVERGWNVEWFTSGRGAYQFYPAVGICTTVLGKMHSANITLLGI